KDPDIRLTMSTNTVERGGRSLAIVSVKNASGVGVDGITVDFTADPFILVTMPSRSNTTAGGGITQVEVNAAQTLGLVQVQASVGAAKSNHARLEIVEKVEALILRIDQRVIAHNINDRSMMDIRVVDVHGAPILNQDITLLSTNSSVIRIANSAINTGDTGVYAAALTAAGLGDVEIVAQYKGQEVKILMHVTAPHITIDAPSPVLIDTPFQMSAIVTRSDNSDIAGVDVTFTGDPAFSPPVDDVTTDSRGVARTHYTPTQNSDIDIVATVGTYSTEPLTVVVNLV
ncbi:MAG: hypothetical protein ACRC6V_11655, partial [Bacteroidales bacterium]